MSTAAYSKMKINKYNERTGKLVATLPLTDDLADEIAQFNGYLTPDEVRRILKAGEHIYTSFSFYCRADLS